MRGSEDRPPTTCPNDGSRLESDSSSHGWRAWCLKCGYREETFRAARDEWTTQHWPAKCGACTSVMDLNAASHGCERWYCWRCRVYSIRWTPQPGHADPDLVLGEDFDHHVATVARPVGLAPTRMYHCTCGAKFLDDSSRSGKCRDCTWSAMQTIRTPAGDIPVIADPTLKPDEFRIESGPWTFAKLPGEPLPKEVEWQREYLGEWAKPPVNAVFRIDPDPPDLKERRRDRVAEHQRDEAMRAGWDGRNWIWCGCASEIGQCQKATCTRHRLAHLNQPSEEPHVQRVFDRKDKIERLNADLVAGKIRIAQPRMTAPRPSSHMGDAAAYAYSCIGVDWGTPEPLLKVEQPTRPDGFAQSRIDEIKAMLLAVGRKR